MIFHIVDPADWPADGEYEPAAYGADGFVHCSYADQVAATAARHYGGRSGLALVELDPAALPDVRVENGFPHVYGPLAVRAAVAVHDLDRWLLGTAGLR